MINCSSCGKKYNELVFNKCPHCGFDPKQKLYSVDEVLDELFKEEMQKKESHKKEVLKHFHIEGNVSDEQFEELDKKYQQSIGTRMSYPTLFTPKAERILNRYATVIKIVGYFILLISILVGLYYSDVSLIGAITTILAGVIFLIICIIIKAFIDVYVNISVTLQDINSKTKSI